MFFSDKKPFNHSKGNAIQSFKLEYHSIIQLKYIIHLITHISCIPPQI